MNSAKSQTGIEIEVLQFIGPLVLFGEGVVLRCKYQDITFIGYYFCGVSEYVFGGKPEAELAAQFPSGRRLNVELELWPGGRKIGDLKDFDRDQALGIYPTNGDPIHQAHDTVVIGHVVEVGADSDDPVLIDCGLPVSVFVDDVTAIPNAKMAWLGDLRMYDASAV